MYRSDIALIKNDQGCVCTNVRKNFDLSFIVNINNYAFMQVLDFCLAVWREELAQEVSYDIDMCSVVHCSLKCISGI